jgi:Ala-tRNA(Pro) deacylase
MSVSVVLGRKIMIPTVIESHLRENHRGFEHHQHSYAMTAQEVAAAEHVTGFRVAKPVVVRLGGRLALAVVSAAERVSLGMLEEATGERAELVPETEFASSFVPCEAGAEPPLSVFGLPIFADEKFLHSEKILMQAGTHEDAIVLDTHEWIVREHVQPVANLGTRWQLH